MIKTKKMAIFLAILVAVLLLGTSGSVLAASKSTGFDEYGYNYNARLFNGWYGYYDRDIPGGWVQGTGDAWLLMKWSKDWTPMADEPVGAWCTNHWTWYSDNIDEATWYGFDDRIPWTDKSAPPCAEYKVEEFLKLMKVGNDVNGWLEYQAGGAYSAGWGDYPEWYLTGDWVLAFEYGNLYIHDMTVTDQTAGTFSGTGVWQDNPLYTWTVVGSVIGDGVSFTIDYDPTNPNPDYQVSVSGTIASDGTMSGSWSSNMGQSGLWESTEGNAWKVPMYVVFQDVITIYERNWNLIGTWDLTLTEQTPWPGDYPHMIYITSQTDGSFSGNGVSLSGPYLYDVQGTVTGDHVEFSAVYKGDLPPILVGYVYTAEGDIACCGGMSGSWTSTLNEVGTLTSTSGQATAYYEWLTSFDLCLTSPKGLGHPIF